MSVWTGLIIFASIASIVHVCVSQDVEGSGQELEVECLKTSALVSIKAENNVVLDYWYNKDDKTSLDITFDNQVNQDEGNGTHINAYQDSLDCDSEYCPPIHDWDHIDHNITHLFPNTLYAFCLVEERRQMMCKNCSTQESVPILHPSLTRIQAGFTEINISWTGLTIEQQGGPHFHYKLSLWELDKPKNNTIHKEQSLSLNYLMTHLQLGTQYKLEIISENIHGPCADPPTTKIVSTRHLDPPSQVQVSHSWRDEQLVATVTWTNDQAIDTEGDLTRRGSILHVWVRQEENFAQMEAFRFSHDTHQLELNLTEARGQDCLVSMSTYYGMHQGHQGPMLPLFYDVVAEAKANLIKLIMLIVGMILLGLIYTIFMCYCCRNLRREGKYKTGEGDKDNANIDKTNFPTIINLQDVQKEGVLADGWKDSGRSTAYSSKLSLRQDHDELGFLYSGMDEDGSFIGDASFAINNGNEAIAMWRQMDAGKPTSA